jgi:hypothetical protein
MSDGLIARGPVAAWVAAAATGLALLSATPIHGQTPGPQLRLDHLTRLAEVATNVVDVTLDSAMLQAGGSALAGHDGDNPALKELLAGLKGVYVKVFEFERDGMYTDADLNAIRTQFTGAWRRFITVKEKTESVEILVWQEGGATGGFAILVAEPRELTVVNIVGTIDLMKLAALGGQFGIPDGFPGLTSGR